MKILVDIPDGQSVGTAVIQGGGTIPPPEPPPTHPPVQPPPTGGSIPAPWDPNVLLPMRMVGTLTVGSGKHQFVPSSNEIQVVQLVGDFTNGGFSSPPPVGQGCWVALGSTPGAHNATGWISGSDNANISLWPRGGNGMYMAMVLDPTHPQPPGTSYYSAN